MQNGQEQSGSTPRHRRGRRSAETRRRNREALEQAKAAEAIEAQFFAAPMQEKPNVRKLVDEPDEDEDTLVDFDTREATAFGVPRPLPLLRVVVVVLAACTFLCVLEVLQLMRGESRDFDGRAGTSLPLPLAELAR